jgi:hypothetical protein
MNLRDGGKNAFLNDPLAVWTGFGARDGDRAITILVQDLAIQRVAPQIATTLAVEAQRDRFLRIANRLYQRGNVVGDIVRVTELDIFDDENGIDR